MDKKLKPINGCPKCGSTNIIVNYKSGKKHCRRCGHSWGKTK